MMKTLPQDLKSLNGTKRKWIKLLRTPFPLGFNGNIYHQGNISEMPDFDVFPQFGMS